jgi:hypothetical protein
MTNKNPSYIVLFLLLSLSICNSGHAQVVRHWDEGPLQWSDFAAKPLPDSSSDYSFFPEIYYRVYNEQLLFNPIVETSIYLNRNTSWIRDAYKNQETLLFFQTYYDLSELYRRLLDQRLKSISFHGIGLGYSDYYHKLERIFEQTQDEYAHELTRYFQETKVGLETERIIGWNNEIENRLDTVNIPVAVPKDHIFGMELLMGPSVSYSDMKDVFRDGFNFDLSFYYMYKRLYLLAGLEFIVNDLKRDEYLNQDIPKGTAMNLTYFNAEAGFKFLDNAHFQVTPFTGFYLGELYLPIGVRDKEGYDSYSRFIGNFQAGLTVDYKFLNAKYRKDPLFHGSFWGLRLKAKYLPVKFDDYKGAKLNISIGFIIQSRGIKYQRVEKSAG